MPATVTPLPLRTPDPASAAIVAELLQLGMTVARVAARLAEVENTALDALADATAAATHALATPPSSLGDALRAGRDADASEAARDAAIARVALITDCFDKAARAVRRTVALQNRLATGRPFTPAVHDRPAHDRPAHDHPGRSPTGSRPADAAPAERADRPEHGDEIGAKPDEEVLRDIRRDLAEASAITSLTRPAGRAGSHNLPPPTPGLAVLPAGVLPAAPASAPDT